MENRLVRHHLAAPDVLSSEQLRKAALHPQLRQARRSRAGSRRSWRDPRACRRVGRRRDRAIAGQGG
jgi:hypothetical protein